MAGPLTLTRLSFSLVDDLIQAKEALLKASTPDAGVDSNLLCDEPDAHTLQLQAALGPERPYCIGDVEPQK